MSMMRCDKHGAWDSDKWEACPRCDLDNGTMPGLISDKPTTPPAEQAEALKPCPFCGHEAHQCSQSLDGGKNWEYFVACATCQNGTIRLSGERYATRNSVAKLWNRRAPPVSDERADEIVVATMQERGFTVSGSGIMYDVAIRAVRAALAESKKEMK